MLNNWRMAQLHAKEAPDRVHELEEWGALFDRTTDGKILQRDFGGHRYARLAHVGDRTGLELIRTLQQKGVAMGIDVFMECKIMRLLNDGDGQRSPAPSATGARPASSSRFDAKSVVLATGGVGKSWKFTSNSWECTGDGHALALWAGAELIDMEFIQFHPTGMVWPPQRAGLLVTEGVRGDGGVLRNNEGERFMFDYIPDMFRAETADTEEEADRWYDDHAAGRRPPELLPRDEVARAINSEVKAGRGSPHGGVFLDIASRRTPEDIRRRLPSMYHQFKELADVDITTEPMEIGPTCHYIMGGVRVDADTAATTVPGLFAAGEVAGGMHGANRLGGNSLSDLLVFGRRAGIGAVGLRRGWRRPRAARRRRGRRDDRRGARALRPRGGREPLRHPRDLQETMQAYVGIIRTGAELETRRTQLDEFAERVAQHLGQGRRGPTTRAGTSPPTSRACSRCRKCTTPRGDRPQGEPRRAHARRLPGRRRGDGQGQLRAVRASGGGWRARDQGAPSRSSRCPTSCKALLEEATVMADVTMQGLARRRERRRVRRLHARAQAGRGRPRRRPPHPGDPGARSRVPLELQGGQVRLVLRGDQRQAPPHVHDADGRPSRGRAGHRHADAVLPDHPRPRHRRLVQLRDGQAGPGASARAPEPDGGYRMQQIDVERGQEFRKCIECFLCQDVCHVIRDHEENKAHFAGPRFFIRYAELEMHPLDTIDRRQLVREEMGLGICNITKCCTEVCPEHIHITDNAIIPLKERVVDVDYDPVAWLGRKILRRTKRSAADASVQPAP